MKLTKGDKTYTLPASHADVTLNRWLECLQFVRLKMPSGLLREFDGKERGDVEGWEVVQWKGQYVAWWLKMSPEELAELPAKDRIYRGEIKELGVLTLFDHLVQFIQPPQVEPIESFTFRDVEYKVSDYTLDVSGVRVPMGTATWGEMEEAMSLSTQVSMVGNGKYDALPRLLAHLYTADGTTLGQRTDTFRDLDMRTVWGCYFFLTTWLATYAGRFTSYSMGRVQARKALAGFRSDGRLRSQAFLETSTNSERKTHTKS